MTLPLGHAVGHMVGHPTHSVGHTVGHGMGHAHDLALTPGHWWCILALSAGTIPLGMHAVKTFFFFFGVRSSW